MVREGGGEMRMGMGLLALCMACVAVADDGVVGEARVVVAKAPVQVEEQIVGYAQRGAVLEVSEVKGDWYWVPSYEGWIGEEHVHFRAASSAAAQREVAAPKPRRMSRVAQLAHLLRDEKPEVRQKAADTLGSLGNAEAVEPLIGVLARRDDATMWHAAMALWKIDPRWRSTSAAENAVMGLFSIVRNDELAATERRAARRALLAMLMEWDDVVRAYTGITSAPGRSSCGGVAELLDENEECDGVVSSIGLKMVLIRPGRFVMGTEKKLGEFRQKRDEMPAHRVTITRSFYLGSTEVTQAQWEAVMKKNPSRHKAANLPVCGVSWNDCQEFCKRLTELERAAGNLPAGARYCLPTEAEWEFACRAGSKGKFCFGDDTKALGDYAWYKRNDRGRPQPVGQKKPNAWGLYDMHGNVSEWAQDWYQATYYQKSPEKNPKGPATGKTRVLRGRAWYRDSKCCRSAARLNYQPAEAHPMFGFRVCVRGL